MTLLSRWAAGLRRLRLIACPPVNPGPIAGLTELRLLDLTGSDLTDLTWLSGLRVEVSGYVEPVGAEQLGPGSAVVVSIAEVDSPA
ncbi:hypothetical protein [Amycolatopsis sp. lyj-109]|uniref:hypothetical protein n=1 Tax=Amycolatopsis sp. lyj-109 TaxID=2789287 RepID=UPI0039785392